ncbi:MAG TPA: tetratricopeptide repeat protein, partial [Pyrinomonadaceae bacterium]|nr:tetratricopeptide repeat protein [Pyrinomonadaceae bacterium]
VPGPMVRGVHITPEEEAMLDLTSQDVEKSESKGGNKLVSVLKFPVKAIGRLFGVGGKKDNNKLQKLSRKDVEKFETVGMSKVIDARTAAEAASAAEPEASVVMSDPAEASAQENLERGRALLNSGNVNDAITMLSSATVKSAKLHEAHNLLGVAYEAKGMRSRAFESLQKAVKGSGNNAEYLNNLGYLHFKNGDYDKAAKYLKRAVKVAPNVQRYWNNLGLIQAQRANFDDAYDCFARAVGEYEGHMNVANRSQSMGYDKTAIKHLEHARALRPATAEMLLRLAVLYKRTGNETMAAEANTALVAVKAQAAAK